MTLVYISEQPGRCVTGAPPIESEGHVVCGHGPGQRGRLSFLFRRLGPTFERRVIVVAPGASRAYHETEWRDALVVVEHGEIELERTAGGFRRFGCGEVLCLAGLPLRALHNRGAEPAVLVAVSRVALGYQSADKQAGEDQAGEEL
ncbi:MAG TPA: hypothetical protein VHH34_20410 [Pseudonocardiaceae bacterium]|nr:hypothetical protein [Pseudonocardiaceae bacterium]